jgi:hypothetical protein
MVVKFLIKSNVFYQGHGSSSCGTCEVESEHNKELLTLFFQALKSAKMIEDWVTISQIWLSQGKVNFVSKTSLQENGVIAYYHICQSDKNINL